jgi:hypothetical protein
MRRALRFFSSGVGVRVHFGFRSSFFGRCCGCAVVVSVLVLSLVVMLVVSLVVVSVVVSVVVIIDDGAGFCESAAVMWPFKAFF